MLWSVGPSRLIHSPTVFQQFASRWFAEERLLVPFIIPHSHFMV